MVPSSSRRGHSSRATTRSGFVSTARLERVAGARAARELDVRPRRTSRAGRRQLLVRVVHVHLREHERRARMFSDAVRLLDRDQAEPRPQLAVRVRLRRGEHPREVRRLRTPPPRSSSARSPGCRARLHAADQAPGRSRSRRPGHTARRSCRGLESARRTVSDTASLPRLASVSARSSGSLMPVTAPRRSVGQEGVRAPWRCQPRRHRLVRADHLQLAAVLAGALRLVIPQPLERLGVGEPLRRGRAGSSLRLPEVGRRCHDVHRLVQRDAELRIRRWDARVTSASRHRGAAACRSSGCPRRCLKPVSGSTSTTMSS